MLQQLKIGPRLVLSFLVPVLLLVLTGVLAVRSLQSVNAGLTTVYNDRVVPLKQLKVIADAYAVNVIDAANKANGGIFTAEETLKAVEAAQVDIQREWAAYLATTLTTEEARLAEEAKALMAKADRQVGDFVSALKPLTGKHAGQLTAFDGPLYDTVDPISSKISELIELQLRVAAEVNAEAASTYERMVLQTVVLIAVAVVLSLWVGWMVARSITRPISQAVTWAQTIAQGDLTSQVSVAGKDEVAILLQALRQMNDSLARIVGEVRQSAESVSTGSLQIAMGSADLSQRTEEQAANLEQTAASMEELTSAVQQNSDTAREARDLASGARSTAAAGGEVVSQVVSTMQEISASSRKIADIIGVIDGIAFQTNILALNAAVEAARAGEQGRGFAVVAAEVRTLAQRSAGAAREIKDLIGASVVKVEAGTQLVDEAGSQVRDIVTQVQRVADLIAEITNASQEQASGIFQVGQAVSQLDQVTQSNAALVEESTAAAESLKAQAARLVQEVSVFRLPGGGFASAPSASVSSVSSVRSSPVRAPAPARKVGTLPSQRASAAANAPRPQPQRVSGPTAPAKPSAAKPAALGASSAPSPVASAPMDGPDGEWTSF
jgi:methyl-accepting chemotaxis protein